MSDLSTNVTRGLALNTIEDAMRFAKMLSDSDFAPKDFRGRPEACFLAIQNGAEVGLTPMQAIQSIAVINGRPSVWGDAALALVMGSSACQYVHETVEGDGENMVATCEAMRAGYERPTVVKFGVADAKKANLWGKTGPWSQYPKRMLQLRARGFALRDAFPDVLRGLVTSEEAQDYPPASKEPVAMRPKFQPSESRIEFRPAASPAALETPESPKAPTAVTTATAEDMERSRLAVSKSKTAGDLEAMRDTTEKRLKSGFYSAAQADDLFSLINGRIDKLTAEKEVVT